MVIAISFQIVGRDRAWPDAMALKFDFEKEDRLCAETRKRRSSESSMDVDIVSGGANDNPCAFATLGGAVARWQQGRPIARRCGMRGGVGGNSCL
jgi:hypothetical protein